MFFGVEDLKTDEIFLKLTKTCEEQPEKRWLPAYYLDICLVDGTTIGKCDLRIGHNDKTYIGGNIGYGILKMKIQIQLLEEIIESIDLQG